MLWQNVNSFVSDKFLKTFLRLFFGLGYLITRMIKAFKLELVAKASKPNNDNIMKLLGETLIVKLGLGKVSALFSLVLFKLGLGLG